MQYPDNFLGLEKDEAIPYEECKVVLLPAPYEGTVSYGKGTSKGPAAIIEASKNLEVYEMDIDAEPWDAGLWTEEPLKPEQNPEKMMDSVYDAAKKHIDAGKFLVMLGGEHSLPYGTVKAYKEKYPDLSVLQLDAHTDLREEFDDMRFMHGTVMARIKEICPAVQVGIRSLSREEAERIKKEELQVFFAEDIHDNDDWMDKAIENLSGNVYITFDLDAFDPSIMPATGTPEPGGMHWYQTLNFLRKVFREKNVVGFDVVELAPIQGRHDCDFMAARLVQKMIGYKFC
ncbi:agmatinase [Candidatus Woesearchaeota archaeon]|nr:agmatinase [Candidatus Woesearchaeota archaeon]